MIHEHYHRLTYVYVKQYTYYRYIYRIILTYMDYPKFYWWCLGPDRLAAWRIRGPPQSTARGLYLYTVYCLVFSSLGIIIPNMARNKKWNHLSKYRIMSLSLVFLNFSTSGLAKIRTGGTPHIEGNNHCTAQVPCGVTKPARALNVLICTLPKDRKIIYLCFSIYF